MKRQAEEMLQACKQPNGQVQFSDVIKPWVMGLDVFQRPRDMWIIDFGVDASARS